MSKTLLLHGRFQIGNNIERKVTKDITNKAILLDTWSMISLFKNEKLTRNKVLTTHGLKITTNAGEKFINKQGNVAGFGCVCYDQDVVTNIFSFHELQQKYRITYDSDKEDAFIVHTEPTPVWFIPNEQGLYYFQVPCHVLESKSSPPSEDCATPLHNTIGDQQVNHLTTDANWITGVAFQDNFDYKHRHINVNSERNEYKPKIDNEYNKGNDHYVYNEP